jgi:polyadenylate-binding protein
MIPAQPIAPFQSASLYVGDLHPEVTESVLFEMFNRVGPVASIRVCRDSMTRRSLGYAYVNFHNVQDAERALDTMNFTDINGKPCRIMWSQRDPSLRKNGLGNIFVRNLAPSVDNKGLYDTFSVFGNILSCKVATDEKGQSKGYGYVHFETGEAAQDAIQKFDGMIIEDSEVKVIPFVRKQDRSAPSVWTNIYLKQFPTSWDEVKLREVFAPFGEIQSVAISRDAEGKSRGFGFVNLMSHEAAAKAVADLNNKVVEQDGISYTIYAGRAQKKSERVRELRAKQDVFNLERMNKSQGKNLYVKNIADNVTDEMFKEAFEPFGKITSAKIMRDKNDNVTSRGFGFVCYETQEEATKAVNEMNNQNLAGKPLYVTYYQKKDQRRAQFAANYAPSNMRSNFGPGGAPGNAPIPFMNMYMSGQQGFPNPRGMPFTGRGPAGAPRPGMNRGGPNYFPGMQPYNMQGKPRGPSGNFPAIPGGFNNGPGMNNRRPGPGGPQGGAPPMPTMGMQPRGPMPGQPRPMYGQMPNYPPQPPVMGQFPQNMPRGGPVGPAGVKFTAQARNQNGQPIPGMMPGAIPMPMPPQSQVKMEFSEALLNTADPQVQKNMIGEKLYPLIHQHQPEQAGKITGMLLEMDNGELLNLIESPEALAAKISEALQVLRNHKPQA